MIILESIAILATAYVVGILFGIGIASSVTAIAAIIHPIRRK